MSEEWDIRKLGSLRRKVGLTQNQLAKLSGVSQSLIAKIESNKIDPAYSKVIAIFQTLENKMNQIESSKTAKDLMNEKIIFLSPQDNLKKAIKLMKGKNISQLPVFQENNPVGSISENMFVDWVEKYGSSVGSITVKEVMGDSFPTIPEDSNIGIISQLLRYYKAVLVKKGSKIIGIITKVDLIKAMK